MSVYKKIVIKLVVVVLWGLFVWGMIGVFSDQILDKTKSYDKGYSVERCDEYYYQKEYGKLMDLLTLYRYYDEEFDLYWEVVNARGDYDRYVQWKMAADKGVEEGEEQMLFFRNQVIKNAKECKFPKNQKELESFAKAVSQD